MASTQEIRAAWDAVAPGYDRFTTPFNVELAGQLLDRIDIRNGMRVLDVAAGTGALAIAAARRGAEVVAVDLAPTMVERLIARADDEGVSGIEGRVMDGQALELDDDSFDVTVSVNGVSLFPDVAAGLRELVRVTRPGGRVLVAAFGAPQQVEFLAFYLGALRAAVPDVTLTSLDLPQAPFQVADPAVLRRMLEEAGLTDVQVGTLTWEMRFDSAQRFWDVVTHSNPIGVRLTSDLTDRQISDVQQVLDGMFRERSGGMPGAVLHTAMNVGIGSTRARRATGDGALARPPALEQEESTMRTHDDTTARVGHGRERIETVIIGGGQAGLAIGQQLAERERSFVIIEANEKVGDSWRRHYDSLRLYNPAKLCRLPGLDFPGPGDHFPSRDEVADYLEDYAATFDLPVRTRTRVDEVRRDGDSYVVAAGDHELEADNVVVATGTFGGPYTPPFASGLDPGIRQLHSSRYKNPSQLQPGPVLVVGAAHSGADIAYELADEHHTVLAGRDTGQMPFDIEGRLARRVIWPVLSFVARRVLTTSTPMGRKVRPKIRAHGGPLIRYKTGDLLEVGVERVEARVTGTRDGLPVLGDGRVVEAANVIWCTGFRQDFSWIRLPIVGEDGWPREERGVVADAPGLYFCGLAFQYSFGSMLFVGVGQDAEHIAEHIVARTPAPTATAAAS